MTEYQEVTLETLAGGAAAEKFGRELSKVLANIEDENTKARAKRSVTLKLTITPNEDRSFCGVNVEVTSKVAPAESTASVLFIAHRRGKIVALEHDPKQAKLFEGETPLKPQVLEGGK